jgi:2-polyprenyl-6-methoxyphenol hydroxylase-like FAD-dependent oxidoreductase
MPAFPTSSLRPIEIVGGGLAGLSLGLALQRAGVPTSLFEAGGYPRHRVCGEFISGLAGTTIERLGLREILADAHPHRTAHYHVGGRRLPPLALPQPALGISRYTLDRRLADAFAAAGGALRANTRAPMEEPQPGRITAVGKIRHGPFWVGLKVHVRKLEIAEDFEIHLGKRAYLGLSKVEDGAVNLCGIFAPRRLAARGEDLIPAYLEAAGLGSLAARLRAAETDSSSFCTTAASLGDRAVSRSVDVRIGDACAITPPYTGNGLAMALQGAELSLGPLLAYAQGRQDWEQTAATIAAEQRRRFGRRLAAAALMHPFFLEPGWQRLFALLTRARLVPFRALYALLH